MVEKRLNVRVSEEEKQKFSELANEYGMDASTFVRWMFRYFEANKPGLALPKAKAPSANAVMMMQ